MSRERTTRVQVLLLGFVLAGSTACSTGAGDAGGRQDSSPPVSAASPASPGGASPTPNRSPTPESGPESEAEPEPEDTPVPAVFDPDAVLARIEHLAGEIGPREATSEAFHTAAAQVEEWFVELGYSVESVPVPVPAGNSWGVDVPEGESANLIADPPGFASDRPHVVIGAHLDTVPQAPGAEDNASGVAVLVELAEMVAAEPASVPVRFIAFGAEEPRGSGDSRHHFGSRQYVTDLTADERRALVAMVALDRVGVPASAVPISTGGSGVAGAEEIADALVDAAASIDVPVDRTENRASDHWQFEQAGLPAARLGSVPYAGYHSADDVPTVVDLGQLDRVGRITWAWLRSL